MNPQTQLGQMLDGHNLDTLVQILSTGGSFSLPVQKDSQVTVAFNADSQTSEPSRRLVVSIHGVGADSGRLKTDHLDSGSLIMGFSDGVEKAKKLGVYRHSSQHFKRYLHAGIADLMALSSHYLDTSHEATRDFNQALAWLGRVVNETTDAMMFDTVEPYERYIPLTVSECGFANGVVSIIDDARILCERHVAWPRYKVIEEVMDELCDLVHDISLLSRQKKAG